MVAATFGQMTTTQDVINKVDGLIAKSEGFDALKSDYKGGASQFGFTSDGKMQFSAPPITMKGIEISGGSGPLGFTDYAFSQLLARFSNSFFGGRNTHTMKREDWQTIQANYPEHFATIMNDVLTKYAQKTRNNGLLMRTYDGDIRAILTSLYGVVDNTAMLHGVRDVLQESMAGLPEMRLVRSEVTPDDMLVQVVWKNVQSPNADANRPGDGFNLGEGGYGAGFSIRNGETGNYGIKVAPMLWRGPCTNSIILQADRSFNARHVGEPVGIIAAVKLATFQMMPLLDSAIKTAFEAEVQKLPSLADVINGFAKEYKWSDKVKDAVLIGTEGRETKMGVVNGVSYAAHHATNGNTDLMVDMSTLAGALLMAPLRTFEYAAQRGHK